MKITVLGASGRTGAELVRQALANGHAVNGVVRRPGSLDKQPNLHEFVGDATNAKVIAEASKGSDVIISVLGGNSSSLMTNAVKAVIEASKATGVKRFILMSSFVVEREHLQGIVKLATGLVMGGAIQDKASSEALLRNSDLDWTIVHATRLTGQPLGSGARVVPVGEKIGAGQQIARADVAAWILDEAEKNNYVKADALVSQ